MENVRKHRNDKRRSCLVSEPNYHIKTWFSENLLVIYMTKTNVKMNKPIYLGFSILEIGETVMYGLWSDYIKPKYNDKANLCYMDTDSFIVNIKTEDVCKNITNYAE